ncbi:MAG TPA: trp RNA-binding attenuation protein MtrB [Clostridiales bacterium]|nr:trp RNA-binding attenuation protein MtrB [Clostridiales bacterium]
MQDENTVLNDYIVVKALEDGVNIMGLTRGQNTKFHHTEKLDKGEVYIAQFTQTTSAIKVNGKAEILTKHGTIKSGADE